MSDSKPGRWRWLLVYAALFVLAVVAGRFIATHLGGTITASPTPTPTPTPEPTTLVDLAAPTCLSELPDRLPNEYEPLDCALPHSAELVALVPIAEALALDDKYERPKDDELSSQAMLNCQRSAVFEGVDAARLDGVEIVAVWPSEDEWRDGMRSFACFVTADAPWQGEFTAPSAT